MIVDVGSDALWFFNEPMMAETLMGMVEEIRLVKDATSVERGKIGMKCVHGIVCLK